MHKNLHTHRVDILLGPLVSLYENLQKAKHRDKKVHGTDSISRTSRFSRAKEWALSHLWPLVCLQLPKEKNRAVCYYTYLYYSLRLWLSHWSLLPIFPQGINLDKLCILFIICMSALDMWTDRKVFFLYFYLVHGCDAGFRSPHRCQLSATVLHGFPHGCFLVNTLLF